jgi:hypothetical protein
MRAMHKLSLFVHIHSDFLDPPSPAETERTDAPAFTSLLFLFAAIGMFSASAISFHFSEKWNIIFVE